MIVYSATNAVKAHSLAKGHHRTAPTPGDKPAVYLLFRAFTRFLPRWQAARR